MQQHVVKHSVFFFYCLTFAISWLAWFLMSRVYHGGSPTPIVYVFSTIGGLGPLLSLTILDRLSHKSISLKQILSQIKFRNTKKVWLIFAVLTLPAITMVANFAYFAAGLEDQYRIIKPGPDELGLLVIPVMAVQFAASLVTSPLFEEPGWRGFALGNLQGRFGREIGSLIVGILWWLWHQPMNLTFGLRPTIYSAVSMVALSFMIDSLFNLSDKNLFTAMLAHQSSGTVITFLYQGNENLIQLSLLIGFVIWLRFQETRMVKTSPSVT